MDNTYYRLIPEKPYLLTLKYSHTIFITKYKRQKVVKQLSIYNLQSICHLNYELYEAVGLLVHKNARGVRFL